MRRYSRFAATLVAVSATCFPGTLWAQPAPATPSAEAATAASPPAANNADAIDLTEAPTPSAEIEPEPFHPMFAPSVRRCGFTVGLNLGVGLGTATGFPNDAKVVGKEEFRTTEFVFAGAPEIYVGGALLDWFVIGGSFGMGPLIGADHEGDFFNMGVHMDVFPAFAAGGAWQDLGIMLNAGVGQVQLAASTEPEINLVDSALGGHLTLGAFYEGIEAWKLSMGPFAAFDSVFSASAARHMAWVGWRTAFYAGPPR